MFEHVLQTSSDTDSMYMYMYEPYSNSDENKVYKMPEPLYTSRDATMTADIQEEPQLAVAAHNTIKTLLKHSWYRATMPTTNEEFEREWLRAAAGRRPRRLECVKTQKVSHCNPVLDRDGICRFPLEPIRPLLPQHIRALVNTFCDPSIRESMLNNPELYKNLRLYVRFGELAPPDEAKNTELCRNAYFDQLLKGIYYEVDKRAMQMGVVLAIIHCTCRYDGAGIKFQIAMHHKRRKVRLWVTDLDHCKTFEASENVELKLALAIAKNPTWPRPPGMTGFMEKEHPLAAEADDTWFSFRDAYLATCCKLGGGFGFCPIAVMDHVSGIQNPDSPCYDNLPARERMSQLFLGQLDFLGGIMSFVK